VRVLAVGAQYPPHHLGGYELIWESGMELLRDAGHDVLVLSTDYAVPEPESRPDPGFEVRRELRWYWSDHEFPRRSMRERLAIERHNRGVLRRALADHRPDVVSWWAMGGMSQSLIELVRRERIPSVGAFCDDWWTYAWAVDQWSRAFASRNRLARAVEAITRIPTRVEPETAIPTWVLLSEELRSRTGTSTPRMRVARRGPDPIFMCSDPFRCSDPWGARLLYLGRVEERKGVDLAVNALAHLPDETTLTIVGDGDGDYIERLRAAAPPGRVEFRHTPRAELPDLVAGADALVFPVRWREPWGLVPLEAMAAGTPVVASGRGGSAEYLRHEENALVFEPDDGPAALAEALRRLAGDAELRARLVKAGRTTAESLDPRGFEKAVAEELERAVVGYGGRDAGR
jgi:glycogen synthase